MKVPAGGWEIDKPVYADAKLNPDRTAAPADEVAQFMAANLFYCHLLSARITERQCAINRGKDLYLCGKCDRDASAQVKPIKPKRVKRHKGDNPESPWRNNPEFIPTACRKTAFEAMDAQGPQPVETEPEPVKADETGRKQVRSGQVRSGQVRSGQVRSGQVRSGQVRSGQVRSGQTRPNEVVFLILQIMEVKYRCEAAMKARRELAARHEAFID